MLLQIATRTQFLCFLVLGLSAVGECLEHRTSKCGFHPSTGQTCTAEADTPSEDKVAIPLTEAAEMEGPMTLVENVDGTLRLNPEAVNVLRTIELPVVVVAVAGAARTGKSYLLNRLAKSKKGFSLGSTVQSQTKGIWMWSLPHPRRVDQRLILLDTEGLGDPEKGDEHNDNSVLSLAILLSSMFVYNSRGTIDQQAMAKLHFVTELAKRIQVKSQSNETEERNFVQFFPDFVWTLRDLTLDLVINESEVTADEYLENSLRLRKDERDQNMDYNALRRCIRDYFPSRRCFAFVCPATRKELKNIQEMPDDQLDPDFVREFHQFSEYVYNNGKVKKVLGGHKVTGKRLSQLVETYVAAIARGDLPCVESGIARMADLENEDAVQRALDYYDRKLTDLLELPAHIVYRLTDLFTFYHNEAVRIFMTHSLMDNSGKHIKKLEETLQFRYKTEISKIENGSRNHCNKVLSDLKASVVENLDSGLYLVPGGYFALDADLDKVINEYNERTLQEVKGLDVLAQFLETVKPRLAEVQKVGSMLHEEGEHMSALKEQLSKAEEQQRARQQQNKAVEGARKEDLVRQMMGKFEDEKERLIAEQTEVIDHKLEEGERYSSEGSEEDRKRNEEESKYYKQERKKAESVSFWDRFRSFFSWLGGLLFL